MSSQTKLALVVAGLGGVGVLIGGLTIAYWRHTRPTAYLAALDVLGESSHAGGEADRERAPVGAAVASATVAMPIVGEGEQSAQPLLDAEPNGGGSAATASRGATAIVAGAAGAGTSAEASGFRIVGPVVAEGPRETRDTPSVGGPVDRPTPDAIEDLEPVAIVTLEDLFGDAAPEAADKTLKEPALEGLWGEAVEDEGLSGTPGEATGPNPAGSDAVTGDPAASHAAEAADTSNAADIAEKGPTTAG